MTSCCSLEAPLGEAFPCIDTKEGVKKEEVVSIGELNKFISNSDEQVPSLDPSKYKMCLCFGLTLLRL